MTGGGPTVPARRLGRELKRLREAIGKTQKEVADWAGTYPTTISKIETGERTPPLSVLKLMLQLFDIDPERAENLTQLAQQAKVPGWWADYGDVVPKWATEYLGMESAASEIWTYEQEYVPGLLQTRAYTEALTASEVRESESAEEFARVRSTRQQRLVGDSPLSLHAVISEAVLHRPVGGPDVMHEQVARLREVMSQPNVTVQVLPFASGPHPGMTGPFTVLRFPETAMNMVFVELRGGSVYIERPVDVELHEADFQRICDLALSEDDTISLLTEKETGY